MKNMIFFVALPFILGCTATAQTTPSKQPKTNRVETFSQLDSTEPAERPNWLQIVPESNEGFYFVGMSTKRTEKRNARNESFNDALIGFARYCGLNVQYLSEHRDTSMGGNGGLINTFSNGNTVAKMQAEMLLGNVATKDRYTEKYSSFYGGSFMGHTFVDATLIYVPKTEMDLCRENRKQANTFIAEQATEVNQLTSKNESLQTENKLLKKQNTNLTNVALNQAHNSAEFFKQAGYSNKKQPVKKVVANKVTSKVSATVATTSKTHNHVVHECGQRDPKVFLHVGNYDGNTYAITQNLMNFEEAKTLAQKHGGRLVTIKGQSENNFLVEHFAPFIRQQSGYTGKGPGKEGGRLYMGLTDITKNNDWGWGNKGFNFRNWYQGQPNNYCEAEYCKIPRAEDCSTIRMDQKAPGKWHDIPCDLKSRAVIEWTSL